MIARWRPSKEIMSQHGTNPDKLDTDRKFNRNETEKFYLLF